jgi:hypothetical protein
VLTTTMLRIVGVLDGAREISPTMIALVAGVPASTFNDALHDKRYMGSEREARLLAVARRCAAIINAIRPLAVPKGDWQTLKNFYESRSSADEIREAITALLEK